MYNSYQKEREKCEKKLELQQSIVYPLYCAITAKAKATNSKRLPVRKVQLGREKKRETRGKSHKFTANTNNTGSE